MHNKDENNQMAMDMQKTVSKFEQFFINKGIDIGKDKGRIEGRAEGESNWKG